MYQIKICTETVTETKVNVDAEETKMDRLSQIFLNNLKKEQSHLPDTFPICSLLIEEAYNRFYSTGFIPGKECNADVLNLKPIKFYQHFFVPECPKLNLKSKLLASKADFLIPLQDDTQCKIIIKGRYSMSDIAEEEELRKSGDPRYNHLDKDLFLEISTVATPIECYGRMANALSEISKYLLSDSKKSGSGEEFLEIIEIGPEIVGNMEYIKQEQTSPDPIAEDPLETNLKVPNLLLDKPQESSNKSLFMNLNSFIACDTSSNTNKLSIENKSITATSTTSAKSTHKKNNKKLGLSSIHVIKKRKSKDFTNFITKIKPKTVKAKLLKKKMIKNELKIKEKTPAIFYFKDRKSNKIKKYKISNKTALSRCLRILHKEEIKPEENDNYQPSTIENLQQNSSELVFEYTPRDIMMSLLQSMKNYPVLWEFHDKPFNKDYNKAIEDLCLIINVEWALNIDSMKMRRSVTRILRFYRYLFPFEIIEQFADYFEKCAGFLPPNVITIPHARCSHCFICYKEDFELKKHISEEEKSLKWLYKCQHCGENFKENKEYEFHKRLPHYLEVFTCTQCSMRFINRYSYNRHLTSHQTKVVDEPRKHICDQCGKAFKTRGELNNHKFYHDEKKFACHLCPKSYFKQTALKLHLKAHRKQLDVICEVCGMGFVHQAKLKEHMVTHSGVKVTCSICQVQVRKCNLYRHLKTVHVAIEGTIEETYRAKCHRYNKAKVNVYIKSTPKQMTLEKPPRQYECKVCNILFDRLKFLKEHNRQLHSDGPKLSCKMCDSELSLKHNLKRHYREKHKLHGLQISAIVEQHKDINEVLAIKSDALEERITNKI